MDPDDAFEEHLTARMPWTEVVAVLERLGWTPCGTGDWAYALRSPSGGLAARISPFDPAAPYSAMLYRQAAHTRQVPVLVDHRVLEGGADLTVMEYLSPVSEDDGAAFQRSLAAREPAVATLARHIDEVHARAPGSSRGGDRSTTTPRT
ncbi:hypothetical protein P9139_13120 [Curtobacterium flaccumfaciens]|nr:hypothetical protein P9139_13120 [Curtobacterium flaccumfaciens]